MTGQVVHMAAMGLLVSVLAPLIVLAGRRTVAWHRVPAPALPTLVGFVLLHGAITVFLEQRQVSALAEAGLHLLLLAGAVVFWLPVLEPGNGCSDAVRSVYLFLAGPSLDLAAVYLVLKGDSAGGIAMIVAMLPVGFAAVGVTWRWISREEQRTP